MEAPAATIAKRKARFSELEVAVLLDNIENHYSMLSSKFSDSVTSRKKNSTWSTITQKVNACAPCLRTVDEVRKKWEDLKSRTKKKAAELNREVEKTGGGKKIRVELNQQERRIVGLLGEARITGIVDGLDTADPADEQCRPTVDVSSENTVPSFDSFDVDTDFGANDQYDVNLSFETQDQIDHLPEVLSRSRASTPCSTAVSARSSLEPITVPSSKPSRTEKSKVTSDIVKIEEERLDVERKRLEIEELEEQKTFLLERLLSVQEKRLHLEELKVGQGQRSESFQPPATTGNHRTGNLFTNMLQWQ